MNTPPLERLLEAEKRAERMVEQATREAEAVIQHAHDDAQSAQQRFSQRIPEIENSFLSKAEQRAGQNIAEMRRRYQDHRTALEEQVRQHSDEAIEAALAILIDPGHA